MDDSSSSEPASTRRTPGPRTAARPTAELPTTKRPATERPTAEHPAERPTTERPTPEKAAEVHPEPHTSDLHQGISEPTQVVSVPTNIYRARRPVVALFLVLPAVAVALFLVRAFAIAAFGSPFSVGGVIASSLALASLPLLVAGLYGLITGAAYGAEQFGFKVWARPPLAYLIVGISFVLGAAVAIR